MNTHPFRRPSQTISLAITRSARSARSRPTPSSDIWISPRCVRTTIVLCFIIIDRRQVMEVVHVPPPPKEAFHKGRPISDLIKAQVDHFKHLEEKLSAEER